MLSLRSPLRHGSAAVLLAAAVVLGYSACAEPAPAPRLRILITNDNGIDDPKIHRLAMAFQAIADVWVVASSSDRSGASTAVIASRSGTFRVRAVSIGASINAFELDGTPADCVLFALSGPLRHSPPDLVVSGINGGANAGDDWISSGTIGAVRVAAHFGVPGVAVSGIVSDDLAEIDSAAAWIVRFAASDPVRQLRAPEYLTLSFPERPLHEITGVAFTRRGKGNVRASSTRAGERDGWQEWTLSPEPGVPDSVDTDLGALARGKVAIVAMRVDENDAPLRRRVASAAPPEARWMAAAPAPAPTCTMGFAVDDVEDASGREWGAIILQPPDGIARQAGFLERDILVAVNDLALASGRGEPDPDVKLQHYLRDTDCGTALSFTVIRGRDTLTIRVDGRR